MKYSEFKKLIKDMGLKTIENKYHIEIDDVDDSIMAIVSKAVVGKMDTYHAVFEYLNENDREYILKTCVDLSLTPLEDREDEEKYYYKLKGLGYLNYSTKHKNHFISGKENSSLFKTHFTDAEFASLPDDIKSHNWEKIKVDREWSEMD